VFSYPDAGKKEGGHLKTHKQIYLLFYSGSEAEFEPRLKFETQLKYDWFHLNLNSMFQDLNRSSIETGFLRF